MKHLHLLCMTAASICTFFSCAEKKQQSVEAETEKRVYSPHNEWPTIDSTSSLERLILPEGFSYTVLFSEGDMVLTKDSIYAPAKNDHDCIVYLPIDGSSTHGKLFVSHETKGIDTLLGDGGGGTVFEVEKNGDKWNVIGEFYNVDYDPVGGTFNNCGGKNTPVGTILSAEEAAPKSREEIEGLFTDYQAFKGIPKHLNYGYMVEIDPEKKQALRKLYQMGRFVHEDALAMPDSITVYLTQDDNPAIFWKFVANKKGDYSKGQLYAYTEKAQEKYGHWLPMPMTPKALYNITDVAVRKGATLYQRHEWITMVGDKIYISETGKDYFDWKELIKAGANPGHQFRSLTQDSTFSDPYGRMLVYDLETQEMNTLLNGGCIPGDTTFCFSNPDGLTSFQWQGKDYLFISEDIIGINHARSFIPYTAINEAYLLDLSLENPTLNDLKRFAIGPLGCETTGGFFTPDGKTLFLSIQHPNPDNPPPFNKSCVVAISGF